MLKRVLFWLLLTGFYSAGISQNLAAIFTNVDTIWPGGAAGGINLISPNVTPIVSSSPCNIPLQHYAVATEFQSGKVMCMAHDGIFGDANIMQNDNMDFLIQAFDWLNPGNKRISIKNGWVNAGNTVTLQNALSANGYTFTALNGAITTAGLVNTDILLLGNDWNGNQPYSAQELADINTFVSGGGAIMIVGLGWSWPGNLNQYPMNLAANLFGFEFNTSVIYDDYNYNGYPQFYNFYPDNLDTTFIPYCPSPIVGHNIPRGDTLRVLRLAVSTTGEFTQQNGGVAATEALIDPWLEQINEIFGREYCMRFELIANNSSLIFPDPTTDPWGTLPPGSGGCTNANIILSQQPGVFDNLIGANNYDISHVIAGSPYGGGCAGSLKTGLSGGFDIPVTRHEMGHQLSQSHTINYPDNKNYEPENGGWTIQGGNQQGHAHGVSYHQLANNLANINPNKGNKIPQNNTIPTVSVGDDAVIPVSTPFTLTATASDPDPGDHLTYVWDNMSRGIPQSIPVGDDSQGALFWRLLPDTSHSRTFPQMSDVIANNNANAQEQLPTQARVMDIRLTVNDNHQMFYNGDSINASGTFSDDIKITVAEAGPFEVTSQNTPGIVYTGGSSQLITWNVNGTDSLPISTQNVRISLSTDGGYTYPITVLNSTPNDGSQMVTLPNISSNTARIKVAAEGNIYFDLNTHDFEIQYDSLFVTAPDLLASTLHIYPNPAQDYLRIELVGGISYSAQLFDLRGQLLLTAINPERLDLGKYPQGIYLLKISDLESGQSVMRRVAVVK